MSLFNREIKRDLLVHSIVFNIKIKNYKRVHIVHPQHRRTYLMAI